MITIIHGDDIVSSRKYLVGEKEKAKNPLAFDGKTVTVTDLAQALQGSMLFHNEKTIFLEDFFSRKKSKEQDTSVSHLQKSTNEHEIYLWEGRNLTKAEASLFSRATVRHFPLPKTIFTFLDNLKPNAPAHNAVLFHESLATTEPELIFFLLVRRIRLLLALVDPHDENSAIEEEKRLAPWQQTRLRNQLRLFTKEKLLQVHKEVFAIDLAQKTGATPLSLVQALDLFLLDL